jgi:hypothetical protein
MSDKFPAAEDIGTQRRQVAHPSGSVRMDRKDPNREDTIGFAGEAAFAKKYGLKPDLTINARGNAQRDFVVTWYTSTLTIDVKTATVPKYLPVKEQHILLCADILVLARYDRQTKEVWFVGWTNRGSMQKCEKKVLDEIIGMPSYCMPARDLNSMDTLDELLLDPDAHVTQVFDEE